MRSSLGKTYLWGAALLAVGAVSCAPEPGLVAHIAIDARVRATCVEVAVFETADTLAMPSDSVLVPRAIGHNSLTVAIFRGDLGPEVWITARPMWGTACQAPLVRNGVAAEFHRVFPPSGLDPVNLSLAAPTAAEDPDGDGFIAAPDGADCKPDNILINPAAPERCTLAVDDNCNNRVGCADLACAGQPCLASPTKIALVNAPLTIPAGTCSASPAVVETQDADGGAVSVVMPTPVTFFSPGNLTFWSDSSCSTPTGTATIPVGGTRAQAYVSGTVVGARLLSADAPGLGNTQQVETITSGPPTDLYFPSAPQTVATNGCSRAVYIGFRDAYGNDAAVTAARTINLSSDAPSTLDFFWDGACSGTKFNFVQMPAGAWENAFYFKSTASVGGTVVITAQDGTSSRIAQQTETLVVRIPTKVAIVSAPQQVPQDSCSAQPVVIQTQDVNSLPAPVSSSTTVTLTVAPSSAVTFYADSACTAQVGSVSIGTSLNQASFYFRGDVQGTPTITGTTASYGAASQGQTIAPPAPAKLVFTSAPQTRQAGLCSGPVTLQTQSALGTVSAVAVPTTVTLSSTLTLYAGAGCGGPGISSAIIPAGGASLTVSFIGTTAGSRNITASAAGLTSASQAETITPGPAALVVIATSPLTAVAGACSGAATVQLQDGYGNPVNSVGPTMVAMSNSALTGGTFTWFDSPSCGGTAGDSSLTIAAGTSTDQFSFIASAAPQAITVTATPGGTLGAATQVENIVPGPPASLVFTSATQSVAAGTCSAPVVLSARDSQGNVATATSSIAIGLGSTGIGTGPGAPKFYAGVGCTGGAVTSVTLAAGQSSVTYSFLATIAGASGTLTATALNNPTQSVVVTPGPPAVLRFVGGPYTVPQGSCSGAVGSLAIRSEDAFGNALPVGGTTPVGLTAPGAALMTFYSDNTCTTAISSATVSGGAFLSQPFYFRANAAGSWGITGTNASYATGAAQTESVPSAGPTKIVIAQAPSSITRDNCNSGGGPNNTKLIFTFKDATNADSPLIVDTVITLGPSSLEFYTGNCNTLIPGDALTVLAGTTTVTVYLKAPLGHPTGPVNVTINSSPFLTPPAPQSVTVN